MNNLSCRADLRLDRLDDYMPAIVDRLMSFDADTSREPGAVRLRYPFGEARLETRGRFLTLEVGSPHVDGLQRLRELVAVAVQIYARDERPKIVWTGDLAGDQRLVTFRKMTVERVTELSPHMRRVRLVGDDLARYGAFGSMHLRVLFPTPGNPDPIWPIAGPNGLPLWPSEERKPVARVYTVRRLDAEAGWMEIDFVVHGSHCGAEGVGSPWALAAKRGDRVGIIGPLGRPVRPADWYVLGCDETGLPAMGRILENLPSHTRGLAFVEVADASERQDLAHPDGVELRWITRDGVEAGHHPALFDAVSRVEWPSDATTFGWFAAESEQARKLRELWRDDRGLGRDQTLVVGYWKLGAAGPMAG